MFEMFKRAVSILLVCIMILVIFPACTDDQKEKDSNKEISKAVLSPESAVAIYMANQNVWTVKPDFMPMQGYAYCLLDLDFDGVLELISSVNDGSSRYSYNHYYRINPDTYGVEQIKDPFGEEEVYRQYDYYLLGIDNVKLLKNKSDGQLFYYCADYMRGSDNEYSTEYGKLWMKDGSVQVSSLFYEYTGNNTTAYRYYQKNGETTDVSPSQYDKKIKQFFKENTDMNLSWAFVNGDEFEKSQESRQTELLLTAYCRFSYKKFSFDDIATYDIEHPQKENPQTNDQNKQQYSMVEYANMTVADVAAIWGDDYTVADYLIGGGLGSIGYEDGRCPFVFCFHASKIPTACKGDEAISVIMAYPKADNTDFYVNDELSIVCTYEEVKNLLPGEYYFNEMDGLYSYNCELPNGFMLAFSWANTGTYPEEIIVNSMR